MKSAAAIVLGLAATACSHDFDVMEKVEQQSIDNAQQTLGFYIPEDQDWKMTSNATANFSVAGASDETYTVKIYSNNLFEDGIGYIITKKNVQGGQNFTAEFAYPAFQKSLYVGLTDSKGRTTYKIADIVDGKLTSLNDVSAARTRATANPNLPAGYSGAYPNANQWVAQGYTVPDPLTPGQKARVQFFFQTKKNPGGTKDYGQIDFFIQQVYDGCTDPITNYSGYSSPAYSKEEYLAADEHTMIQSGAHMDHLVAGSDNKHIYNFNNGTCSTNYNVGDTGAPLDTDQHPDEIMLMINTKTDYFGYANSDASFVRNDRYNLVAGSVIDAYIEEHKADFIAWKNKNEKFKDEKDDIVDDKWHRGFIGFDFDQLPDKSTISGYKETKDADGFVISSSADYAELGGFPGGVEYVWDGENVTKISSWDNGAPIYSVFGDKYLHYENGKKVPYVITTMNMYCGETLGYDGENGHRDFATSASINSEGSGAKNDQCVFIEQVDYVHDGQTEKVKAFNLKWLKMMLDEGYCPVAGKSMKLWTRIGGCADGYYSDWIVSFLPADPNITIIEEENQTYTYAFEDNKTTCDFDLNDVVIWVKENENDNTKIDITLVAAGCEFDNYVFLGTTRIEWPNGAEVHDALGVAKGVMFNTKSNTVDPSTFVTTTIDIPQGFNIELADFKIKPYAKGSDFNDVTARKIKDDDGYIRTSALVTMESETATAPIGLVFPCKWHWPKERVIVSNAYDNFTQWGSLPDAKVRATVSDWYKSPVSGQVVTWETTNE